MSKVKIHKFDPVIYPIKLWVCFNAHKYILEKKFKSVYDITDDMFEEKTAAVTCCVNDKKTNSEGIVVFTPDSALSVECIAHEATHVADEIFEYIGEETKTDECYAYLVGWAAKSIDKAMKLSNKCNFI